MHAIKGAHHRGEGASTAVQYNASPINAVLILHFISQVNAGVAVTESSHILHLVVAQR